MGCPLHGGCTEEKKGKYFCPPSVGVYGTPVVESATR